MTTTFYFVNNGLTAILFWGQVFQEQFPLYIVWSVDVETAWNGRETLVWTWCLIQRWRLHETENLSPSLTIVLISC